MFYIAEAPVTDDDLDEKMNRMRAWLDHQRIQPSSFRLSLAGDKPVVRVSFEVEAKAAAFAAEFGGSMLSLPVAAAAIA